MKGILQLLMVFKFFLMNRKKMWVDKGSKFYNRLIKSWVNKMLQIEMYSTHNEGKSIVAEKFIRTLNIKICKYMTSI